MNPKAKDLPSIKGDFRVKCGGIRHFPGVGVNRLAYTS